MNKSATAIALISLVALSACGGSTPAENSAAQLEEAAEQSDPSAAPILENAADQIRDQNAGDANAAAQQALEQAGNVQAGTVSQTQTPPPPAVGAKPHQAGDPVPPPKTKAPGQ